jgi:hypothetical protein
MIKKGKYIYKYCETGDWLKCGEIKLGIDSYYIQWFI